MVDVNALMLEWLRSSSTLQALCPSRGGTQSMYSVALPPDFAIPDGPAIVLSTQGGRNNPEISTIIQPRIQITVWADVVKHKLARQIQRAMYDLIQGKKFSSQSGIGTIMSCFEVVAPQELVDPDTDWAMVVSFYEVFARS